MSADTQLKAFIDRVLRLKEEQDTIGQDIRDIYGEAKAAGYDKTVMGKLVAYLRKVDKAGASEVEEAEMIFDTYLDAYRRASGFSAIKAAPSRAHAHEEEFDPITGEFLTEHQASDDAPIVPPSPAESEAKDISASSYSRPATLAVPGGEHVERKLLCGGSEYTVLIDPEDEHLLDERTWVVEKSRNTFYVHASYGDRRDDGRPMLHRLIMNAGPEDEIDHRNGNGLDVRKANLRKATRQQNAANRVKGSFENVTSEFKGVYQRSPGRWVAQITVNNANRHLGSFASEEDAARCYDAAAVEAFGEFAKVNFPSGQSGQATTPVSEIAPASQGEAEATSVEGVNPNGEPRSPDANTGGDHVTDDIPTAATAGALVRSAPAKSPLRPHCLNPGEQCGGYGTKHCRSCTAAMQEREVA